MTEPFVDTNGLLYLLSSDSGKADCAESALVEGGILSVQVLNEFASVATRKGGMSLDEVREFLATLRAVCRVESVTAATHEPATLHYLRATLPMGTIRLQRNRFTRAARGGGRLMPRYAKKLPATAPQSLIPPNHAHP